ncbi:hypothetical protein BH09PSE1_BH09PSE1_28540 [soil metagenome]
MSRILSNIDKARDLLVEAEETVANPLGALGAAAFAATAAITMAGVMILGTGMAFDHPRAPTEADAPF